MWRRGGAVGVSITITVLPESVWATAIPFCPDSDATSNRRASLLCCPGLTRLGEQCGFMRSCRDRTTQIDTDRDGWGLFQSVGGCPDRLLSIRRDHTFLHPRPHFPLPRNAICHLPSARKRHTPTLSPEEGRRMNRISPPPSRPSRQRSSRCPARRPVQSPPPRRRALHRPRER